MSRFRAAEEGAGVGPDAVRAEEEGEMCWMRFAAACVVIEWVIGAWGSWW